MTTTHRRPVPAAGRRREIHYPERDGKPMGETPVHRDVTIRLIQLFQDVFAQRQDVYVSGDMMCYYEEGNPRRMVSPDVFVAFGAPKLPERRVYKLWEEPTFTVVFEITSRSTRKEDVETKLALYERLGVAEYFLFDPLGEYLRPPLQGWRLLDGSYHRLVPDGDGAIDSAILGMRLAVVDGVLRLFDRVTGAELLTPAERTAVALARAEAEAARAEAEAAARQAAEARIAELEARLARRDPPSGG